MNTTNNNNLVSYSTDGCIITSNSNWLTVSSTPGTTISTSTTFFNNMTQQNFNNMTQQNFVAVFLVERNDDNKIIKSTHLKSLWVETKPGISLDYAVARVVGTNEDPSKIIFKVLQTVTF